MGAVLHTVNLRLGPDELAYLLHHAEDGVVIADGSLLPILAAKPEILDGVRTLVVVGPPEADVAVPTVDFDELVGPADPMLNIGFGGPDEIVEVDGRDGDVGFRRADHDERAHAAQDLRRSGEHRQQRAVGDDDTVLGVMQQVRQLVGAETEIDRVQHRPHARHREVGDGVPVVIPAHRGDAIPRLARRDRAAPTPDDRPTRRARRTCAASSSHRPAIDDRAVAVHVPSVAQDHPDAEVEVGHRALHVAALPAGTPR